MRASLVAFALCLVAAAAAAGCKQPAPAGPPVPPTFDERQACAADADCAAVELACCDHCNGGRVVGVHKDYAADVRREHAPPAECDGVACTEMACAVATPICRAGRCGISLDGAESLPELPAP